MPFASIVVAGELWASTLGELLHEATRVEVVDVTAIDPKAATVTAKVVEPYRSALAVGAVFTAGFNGLESAVKVGDRVLVICDRGECPRAIGVERGGWFQLEAQEPMDGAFVMPNLVAHLSLPALVVGKPAPPLCAKGSVRMLDEPAAPLAVDAHSRATDGDGTGTLAGLAVHAGIGGGDLLRARHPTAAIEIRISGDFTAGRAGAFELTGTGAVTGGCFAGTFAPEMPGPRTRAGIAKALAGKLGRQVFARGTLQGKPFELAVDGTQYALRSELVGTDWVAMDSMTITRVDVRLGFPESATSKDQIVVEIPTVHEGDLIPDLAAARSVKAAVARLVAGEFHRPIGGVQLAYVPEKP